MQTTRRRNADGSEVRYYQLAENTWDAARGCAMAKVVYNFGRADQLDGDKLRRLAKSILRVFGEEQPPATPATSPASDPVPPLSGQPSVNGYGGTTRRGE